ncbi:MFS transporter [Paenibacillus sp. 5J-6]|uniref:MFS transporter n=2 Tax=Paenibacillus silvestris TaxID=2606219 RepID=A0A6L8V6Q8_9BACL|nr:MFS transporter [Paenibacillus silvestris]
MSSMQRFMVFCLFLLTFTVGTSEFVVIGLLNEIAEGLNQTISSIGIMVTGFAVAFAVGTPIFTSLLSRFPKYPLILSALLVFIAGNVLGACSHSFTILFLSRIVTAIVTGVLIANAMTLASVKVPQEKIGSVISIVFSGFTIAGVLGVPLGTYIGQTSGWRMTFWSIVILGGVLFVISLFALPRDVKGEKGSLKLLVKFIAHPKIILTALIPALSIGATYAVYTYLTPLLEEAVGIPRNYISAVLLMYGVISVVSNLLAGAIAKRESISKLRFVFLIQAVILAALFLTSHLSILALINIGLMSLVMYLAVPALQMYFIQMADRYFPAAKDLASALTPISLNVGIALGSLIGSWTATGMGLIHVTWIGGIIALLASFVTFISYRINRK